MKKITSLSLGLAFLIMSYTGIMLFLCPHGRVAYWSDWHLLGLSKTQYGELHTTSMLTFLFFGLLHIYYNWKPIISYLKDSTKKVSFTKKEFLIAFSLNLLFIVGTLFMIQPFKGFLDLGERIKDGWTQQYGEPPYGHAEETKLFVFCKKMDIDLERAKAILTDKQINFKETQSLKTIANNNNLTPNEIYTLIKEDKIEKPEGVPSQLGRKTLQELSNLQKIELQKAIVILQERELTDINPKSRIKNIADELDLKPLEVYQLISQ
ncbi:MAG: DUF4405 domain-containing protein [Epsilonproteobacteria bacterium]|nr:DUF4405 domain-containing protein [Campylobacterota bacterium]